MKIRDKTYRLMVEGSGDFPFDMLRYDQCWPADEKDSAALVGDDRRRIVLESASETMPTGRRWESRGWAVVQVGHATALGWERAI